MNGTQLQIGPCSDNSFGPTVYLQACRDGFDFTLLFEESFFTVVPGALLLCATPLRLWSICRRPDAVKWPLLRFIKLMTIIALCLIKLSLLVFWSLPQNAIVRTRMTIAAAVFDLAAAVAIGLLSPLEHAKSLRPSILLSVFLFFTTILDVARTRTEWLLSGSSVIPSLFVTSLAVKCLLVVLEGLSKASHSQAIDRPEQTSGIYSLSFFAWLNPLIYRGNRGNLRLYDLNPVDQHISSTWVNERVKSRWNSSWFLLFYGSSLLRSEAEFDSKVPKTKAILLHWPLLEHFGLQSRRR